jgi:predicted amidohydrolase YtcJ
MGPRANEPAEVVYVNGDVVTMDDRRPHANAVAVGQGRILAVGDLDEVEAVAGRRARVVDLGGRALVPGFVDAHGHFTQVAGRLDWVDLSPPPAGRIKSIDDLIGAMRRRRGELAAAHKYVLGAGYDETMLAEGRHPTKEDLDRVSTELPVWVVHVSRRMAVGNSVALDQAGIDAATPNPEGGRIARKAGSREPTGLVEEAAWAHVRLTLLPAVPDHRLPDLLRRTGDYYARFGITTAQDGATDVPGMKMLRLGAEAGVLPIDVVAYPLYLVEERLREECEPYRGRYRSRLRVGGSKILLDGSPQGKTAWLTQPYLVPPEGEPPSYTGGPKLADGDVERMVEDCFRRGVQLFAHANGDAAADQLIGAVARAEAELGPGDRRPVMIHAQTVRDDQLRRMKELGIFPSFFSAHCFYWGDWHVDSVLGRQRAYRISPARTARDLGLPFSIHNDPPVVQPSMAFLMWNAVTRLSRTGQVIGPAERLSAAEALRAITLDAAYQIFEEGSKGSIEVGKLADLAILSANPLAVAPEEIRDIQVLATLKEGVPVFVATTETGRLSEIGAAAPA